MEDKILSYFRVKSEYTAEDADGALSKVKVEELVYATTYTEVETLVHQLAEQLGRTRFGSYHYEIIKTKIADVLYNDVLTQDGSSTCGLIYNGFSEGEETGVGLYAVKVIFISIDEKSAKEKRSTEVYYVPADSNADATNRLNQHFKESATDYIIRDTKFDKAEAIYWPQNIQQDKVSKFDLG